MTGNKPRPTGERNEMNQGGDRHEPDGSSHQHGASPIIAYADRHALPLSRSTHRSLVDSFFGPDEMNPRTFFCSFFACV